ncbi:MAG: hypothetical protein ACRDFB_08110 [Rhabdochlamydiaceae bacterium]
MTNSIVLFNPNIKHVETQIITQLDLPSVTNARQVSKAWRAHKGLQLQEYALKQGYPEDIIIAFGKRNILLGALPLYVLKTPHPEWRIEIEPKNMHSNIMRFKHRGRPGIAFKLECKAPNQKGVDPAVLYIFQKNIPEKNKNFSKKAWTCFFHDSCRDILYLMERLHQPDHKGSYHTICEKCAPILRMHEFRDDLIHCIGDILDHIEPHCKLTRPSYPNLISKVSNFYLQYKHLANFYVLSTSSIVGIVSCIKAIPVDSLSAAFWGALDSL